MITKLWKNHRTIRVLAGRARGRRGTLCPTRGRCVSSQTEAPPLGALVAAPSLVQFPPILSCSKDNGIVNVEVRSLPLVRRDASSLKEATYLQQVTAMSVASKAVPRARLKEATYLQ